MPSFPERPAHLMPGWVSHGSVYHIRIRAEPTTPRSLTDLALAPLLLESARHYHLSQCWYCHLFLLMPDHVHALLAFPPDRTMSATIGAWKGFQAKRHGVRWQGNYFDHRIRHAHELNEKAEYIRQKPRGEEFVPDCERVALGGYWRVVSASGGRAPPETRLFQVVEPGLRTG